MLYVFKVTFQVLIKRIQYLLKFFLISIESHKGELLVMKCVHVFQ